MTAAVDPSRSTDPTPGPRERPVDGLLRAAANMARGRFAGAVGEELAQLMWVYYGTPEAYGLRALARAILDSEAG